MPTHSAPSPSHPPTPPARASGARGALCLWVCAVAAVLLASGASAQTGWGGGAFFNADVFRADREAWHEERLVVQRRFSAGAASLEGGTVSRNGFTDPFVATDLYARAGTRGYGNLRAQWAPEASGVPRLDLLAEAYAVVGTGWEASLGARHIVTASSAATLGTGSVAKYVGNWTVRARGVATLDETIAVSTSLSARYLFDGVGGLTAPFAEVTVGRGREPVVAAGGLEIRPSWVVSGRVQREVRSGFGVSASLGYIWDDSLTRWTGGLGVTGRF